MKTTLKNLLPLAGVLCACVTTLAHAADTTQSQASPVRNDDMKYREITPNAGPRVTDGADVFVAADFIYWTARQDGLAFARTGVRDTADAAAGLPAAAGVATKGTTYHVSRGMKPGFKVALGLALDHDGWDTLVRYTWLNSNQSKTVNAATTTVDEVTSVPLSSGVTPLTNVFNSTPTISFEKISSHWKLNFNNFDWELGRNYFVSQYLTLRPHAGLKGGWYSQTFNVNMYNPVASTDVVFTTVGSANSHNSQKFWWVGIRAGLDTAYHFTKNWSLFGNVALSTNWGQYHVTRKDNLNNLLDTQGVISDQPYVPAYVGNRPHSVKAVVETQIGFAYDYWWSEDDYHLGVNAAWENQVWFNQNQIILNKFADAAGNGDLNFQGFTLSLRLDF